MLMCEIRDISCSHLHEWWQLVLVFEAPQEKAKISRQQGNHAPKGFSCPHLHEWWQLVLVAQQNKPAGQTERAQAHLQAGV